MYKFFKNNYVYSFIVKFSILLMFVLINPLNSFAITSYGEGVAKINNGNVSNAKIQALNFAKLEAIENVSSINIKNETLVKNSKLLDETIKKEFSGKIKDFTIIEEKNENGYISIKIKANIDVKSLKDNLKPNYSKISAYLTVLSINEKNQYVENEEILKSIKNELTNNEIFVNNYTVNKIFNKNVIDSIISKKYSNLNIDFIKSNYDSIIVGITKNDVKYTDVGYGDTKFAVANGEFTWYVFSKVNGKFELTKTDTLLKRGVGATESVALSQFNKNIIDSSFKIASDISEVFPKNEKRIIKIKFGNEFTLEEALDLKKVLQNIPFLLNIKMKDLDYFLVEFTEKPYYLAVFLEETKKYVVKEIKNNELVIIII